MKRITDKKSIIVTIDEFPWPREKPGVIQVGDYTKWKTTYISYSIIPMLNQYTITIIIM